MEPQPNELKALRIMFFALLIGQILFGLIVTVLVETGIMSNGMDDLTSVFRIGLILIITACIPVSFILFRKRLTEINSNFLLIYPSREKIINELQLSSSEQSAFGLD